MPGCVCIYGGRTMELSGLNPQDKHGRLTPPLAAGRPQMLTSTVGAHGLPCPSSTSPSILHSPSQETISPPTPFSQRMESVNCCQAWR